MEDSVSEQHETKNENSENGKAKDKFLFDGSDDEEGSFTEKPRSDSMLLSDSTEERGMKGKLEDDKEEGGVENGLVSFQSLMDDTTTQEIELSSEASSLGDIEVSVALPKKSGEGMAAHLVYPVSTKTTMKHFIKHDLLVSRRFNDFLTLYDNLVSIHQPLGIIIPLPPEKDMIGMTKMKISKEEEVNSLEFVEKRRAALERFLSRLAQHPSLVTDKFFITFLQLEGELVKASGGGLLRGGIAKWFGRVGESFNKITSALPEHDQWYEDRQELMEGTEYHLRELLTATEALIQQRKDLSQTTTQLARAVGNLGSTEEDLSLSKLLSSLSEALDETEKLRSCQDMQVLLESMKDNLTFITALRLSMDERIRVHKAWKSSEATLANKVEHKAKLENQKKTDQLEFASMEIHEWEEKVAEKQGHFEKISETIKKEAVRLDKGRVKEVRATILECLRSNLQVHRQVDAVWTSFLPLVNKPL